jgi:hypothetical protein
MRRNREELVDVIATGPAAEPIVQFRASDENQRHVADLLAREKTASLTPSETAELDRYLQSYTPDLKANGNAGFETQWGLANKKGPRRTTEGLRRRVAFCGFHRKSISWFRLPLGR